MKQLLFATGLFVTLTCAGLNAQTVTTRANIPFNFQVGKTPMPAGEYTFHCEQSVLTIRSVEGKPAVLTLARSTSRSKTEAKNTVQFHRYGGTYFLAGLWAANSRDGVAVPQSAAEKELARRIKDIQAATVALAKQ